MQDYLAAGSRMVWVVSPKLRTVTIYKPDGKIDSLSSQEMLEGGEACLVSGSPSSRSSTEFRAAMAGLKIPP